MGYTKKGKFSYSKLNVFGSCGFKYYLQYKAGHFVNSESIAIDLGVTLHSVEEQIFNAFKNGEKPDYEKLKDYFLNVNIPKKDQFDTEGGIYGMNIIKEKYKEEYYKKDDNGQSYYTKVLDYLSKGIYRIENYLNENPDIVPYAAEQYYAVDYNGYFLNGYIDRIFFNKKTGVYIIEDIKTKGKPFKDKDLVTPLQLAIYTIGLAHQLNIPEDKITCVYDLPLCGIKQPGGTPGFMKRARRQLDNLFEKIEQERFDPSPSPLCYWCHYCDENPLQPEEGKHLCPYYSLWKPDAKTYDVKNQWEGLSKHEEIMERYLEECRKSIHEDKDEFDD